MYLFRAKKRGALFDVPVARSPVVPYAPPSRRWRFGRRYQYVAPMGRRLERFRKMCA